MNLGNALQRAAWTGCGKGVGGGLRNETDSVNSLKQQQKILYRLLCSLHSESASTLPASTPTNGCNFDHFCIIIRRNNQIRKIRLNIIPCSPPSAPALAVRITLSLRVGGALVRLSLSLLLLISKITAMIHNYSKEQLLGGSGERKGYRVSRNGRDYFMEEYSLFNISHENTYKLKSRLAKSTHLLPLLEQFEHQDRHYFVYEYTEDSLQSYMSRKEGRMLHPSEALKFYASLVEFADSCHEQMFLLRAFNPARIRVRKDSILFYDLTAGVQMKKRRKLFENINSHYIAPECLSEDGYSQEVDVWAGGVLLYYMLTGAYPFQVEGKSTLEIQQQFEGKVSKGFQFHRSLEGLGSRVDSLKSHPHLEELFRSIFTFSQYDRIGLVKICEHPLLKVHFNKQFEFSSIAESQHEQSIFFTQLNLKSKWVNFLHKEEVILDFIERASESLALECHDVFEEDMRLKVHSAVLKMALIKCHNLIDLLYARIKPFFEVDVAEWEAFRKSAAGEEVRRKMERKEKLLTAAFKGAKAQFKSGNLLFDLSVPKSFNDIKNLYRAELSIMYRIGRNELKKLGPEQRERRRRLVESLVRIVIFYLVNRLFTSQEQIEADFEAYYRWSRFKDFEDLEEWILNEEIKALDEFIIKMVNKYLISNSSE